MKWITLFLFTITGTSKDLLTTLARSGMVVAAQSLIERVPENSAILRKAPEKSARQKAKRKILKKMESLGLLRNQEVRGVR